MGGGKFRLCRRRFAQLMVPYMAWAAIGFALSGSCSWGRVAHIVLHPDTSFWFLWVLFFINVIFILCQWVAERWRVDELWAIGTACLLLLGVMVGMEFRLFGFQFIAYYFVFYSLGYCLRRYPCVLVTGWTGLGVLIVLWAGMAWWWNMHELPGWMPVVPHVPGALVQYAYRGLTALLAVWVLVGAAPRILNGKVFLCRWLGEIGVVSLGYYTGHLTMMGHVTGLLRRLLPEMGEGVLIVLSFTVTLVLTVAVVELLRRNKITARLLLGKV